MEKPRPGSDGSERLGVRGSYGAIRELHGLRTDVRYEIQRDDDTVALDAVQWADWGAEGRLLVATQDGRLRIREEAGEGSAVWQADEGSCEPERGPAPPEASEW